MTKSNNTQKTKDKKSVSFEQKAKQMQETRVELLKHGITGKMDKKDVPTI